MTAFAQRVLPRGAGPVLLGASGRGLTQADLAASGTAPALGPGARVAVQLSDPLDVVRALAALDGQVAAILLLSHALPAATALALARAADCGLLVRDAPGAAAGQEAGDGPAPVGLDDVLGPLRRPDPLPTAWLMTTSGTTGLPKIVPHTLASLSRSVYRFDGGGPARDLPIWGLLYDPTRFAGLQVVLQALIGGGLLVAADTGAPLADQIATLAAQGCTHLSATPTLWRRLLMVPGHDRLALRQVTLGGEIADQPTLNALRAAFPAARLTHIYASTEAGVGFSVTDGLAGFPRAYLDRAPGNVRLDIRDGVLWLRPPVTALRPGLPGITVDAQGYVCSGDRVAVGDDRITFLGRENGLINIGGVKVYPETVEAALKTVPGVGLVQVSAKRSPVTGALVLAEVQLAAGADAEETRRRILETGRARLPREAVPAIIRFVEGFETNAAGKLVRKTGQGAK
jgi:acyl-CoA synthetase (AMP-forming)/AMP-acid ligase II